MVNLATAATQSNSCEQTTYSRWMNLRGLSHVTIRAKLRTIFTLILATFLLLGALFLYHHQLWHRMRQAEKLTDDIDFLTRTIILGFYRVGNCVHNFDGRHFRKEPCQGFIGDTRARIGELEAELARQPASRPWSLRHEIDRMAESAEQVFDLTESIGYNESRGLHGRFRDVAHRLEGVFRGEERYRELSSLLQMRRHEKDFLMRLEPAYQEKFEQEYRLVREYIEKRPDLTPTARERDLEDLREYHALFRQTGVLVWDRYQAMAEFRRVSGEIFVNLDRLQEDQQRQRPVQSQLQETAIESGTTLILGLGGLLGVLLLGITSLFFRSIARPIGILAEQARGIAQGDHQRVILLSGSDEIGQLAANLQEMKVAILRHSQHLEAMVALRTESLQQANDQLRETIHDLETTREELIHVEKMASLGRLVAGFAHEVNTPVGIAVGSFSQLPEVMGRIQQMLQGEEVDGDLLDREVAMAREAVGLGMTNLFRAAEIVSRFKRTTLDQASEERRLFNVCDVIEDVLVSVHNAFKSSPITITWECPPELEIFGQPGLMGQLLTNLLMNSHRHGFDDGKRGGTIRIEASLQEEMLHLDYRDDGRGMTADVVAKAFDPFFTTARERGGSGLGLYICYNIVRNQLQGAIHLRSEPGEGVCFTVRFPATLSRLMDGFREAK
ncbi:MAG: HAMP domain-containing histidine kinase [Magnetococcales bacterium]|nr:HAMP domain-containing histidine kinase [Magnetococcales bacterium]